MRFVAALRSRGVAFLVAPYEADAQMAYLALNGTVSAVVTEDSDLLPYGCPAVFFKMDRAGGGVLVRAADFPAARRLPLAGFDTAMLQETCALAGCDFVKGLPGIGVVTAAAHVRKHRSGARALRALRLGGRVSVPPGYEAAWARAVWTFRHQRVWCPTSRTVVHVSPLPPGGLALPDGTPLAAAEGEGEGGGGGGEGAAPDPLAFLGPDLPPALAAAIAAGKVDPITHRPWAEGDLAAAPAPAARGPQRAPPQGQQRRFTFQSAAARGGAGGARPGGGPPARPLPVAANGVAALFARHTSAVPPAAPAALAAFIPPRSATVAGGGSGAAAAPSAGRTPAERAAIHGPGGWGSQPPDGWGRRAGGGAGADADARPLPLSGPPAPSAGAWGAEGDEEEGAGDRGRCHDDNRVVPSPAALERALAAERAPFAACFAWGGGGGGGAGDAEEEEEEEDGEEGAHAIISPPPAPAAAASPAAGPRWGATPAGWRDFYATSPASGGEGGRGGVDENAPGGGRRSAHFPPGASPPPKRAALFEEGGGGGGPVPFGGLGHVSAAAAAAVAAVGRPGSKKKKKGSATAATTTATPATRPPFSAFAFGK